jgi:hypothetical protein
MLLLPTDSTANAYCLKAGDAVASDMLLPAVCGATYEQGMQ